MVRISRGASAARRFSHSYAGLRSVSAVLRASSGGAGKEDAVEIADVQQGTRYPAKLRSIGVGREHRSGPRARASSPTEAVHGVSTPSFCVIAQGSKEILLGDDRYRYDPAHYLITTAALPVSGRILEPSEKRPYLSLRLDLDPALVGSVMVEAVHPAPQSHAAVRAIDVSPLEAGLLDAVVRLLRLPDSPAEEARFLRPLVTREIVFRLLVGEQGCRLHHAVGLGGHGHRIGGALERLRNDFDRPLRVEDVAREVGMSVSSFHHHFRSVTAMSPLQFQKRRMRLQAARRLMIGEDLDAASAGYRVGYCDASQFSRGEYKRLFGAPPMRDVERLREAETASDSLRADWGAVTGLLDARGNKDARRRTDAGGIRPCGRRVFVPGGSGPLRARPMGDDVPGSSGGVDPLPDAAALEGFFEACYQASMLREEERPVVCRAVLAELALFEPEGRPPEGLQRLKFPRSLPFDPRELRRLSVAADPQRTLIGA